MVTKDERTRGGDVAHEGRPPEAVATSGVAAAPTAGAVPDRSERDLLAALTAAVRPEDEPNTVVRAAAEIACDELGAAFAVVELLDGAGSIEGTAGREAGKSWEGLLRSLILDAEHDQTAVARQYASNAGGPACVLVAAPIPAGAGAVAGGLGIVRFLPDHASEDSSARVASLMSELRAAAAHLALILQQRVGRATSGLSSEFAAMIQRTNAASGTANFAFAITNALRSRVGAELAGFGTVHGTRIRLQCISGQDDVPRRGPGARQMVQAMEESLDAGRPIIFAAKQTSRGAVSADPQERTVDAFLINARWRATGGGGGIATVPLRVGSEVVAVVTLRMPPGVPLFDEDLRALDGLLAPLAPMVPLIMRASEGALGRLMRRVSAWRATRRRPIQIAAAGVLAIVLAWSVFGSLPYDVGIPAVVRADGVREVAAPMAGRLTELSVQPGRTVRRGDVLARLDTHDDRVALTEAIAAVRVSELAHRAAVRDGDVQAAARAEAEAVLHEARRVVLEGRLERAVIRAPIDGLVLESAEAEREGSIVAVGDQLVRIAPSGALHLELQVPEHAIDWIEPRAPIHFAANAAPEVRHAGTVRLIAPAANVQDGTPVFVCTATFESPVHGVEALGTASADATDAGRRLRPGMEGVARVDAGRRAPWWILLHRFIDPIRVRL